MINCRLYRDIEITSGSSSGCGLVDINVGIQDGLYVFNLEDVDGLIFENDSRPDKSLFVDTIITSQPYYRIDATNINFQEDYEDHYYHQELTADINSVRNEIEEILEAAVHGKYLVAFKVIGNEHYKLIGWKEGLTLDDTLTISTDNNSFQLTFTGNTSYPMMEADKSNFKLSSKVYEPIFEPLFERGKVICDGYGWATAMYVVKVNAAGQPLDDYNMLIEYSGLKQAAYKLSGVSDGNYDIIGTFDENDYFNGKSVRIFDPSLCQITGSITVSPDEITLCSTNTEGTITITSTGDWELTTYPSFVEISRTSGEMSASGITVALYSTENGGDEVLYFRNKATRETASVEVHNDRIGIEDSFTFENGTTNFELTPVVNGDYSASTTIGTATILDDGTLSVAGISSSNDEQTGTITLSKGECEVKEVEIIILGINASRGERAITEWCEVE